MPILNIDGKKFRLGDIVGSGSSWTVPVDDAKILVETLEPTSPDSPAILARIGGKVLRVVVDKHGAGDSYSVELNGKPLLVRLEKDVQLFHTTGSLTVEGPIVIASPMAGKIASVKISRGSKVEEGQALFVLEAMKMENEIAAPRDGTVKDVYVQQGTLAKPGDKLALID
ncbi:MAG TPA: biotin/lipoyl-containing protein [Candidatus Dormibacteraeota bacterium]|nr:biotin/lipoyl-containing protein [Candidatus Dormibacteraeota bacterium]